MTSIFAINTNVGARPITASLVVQDGGDDREVTLCFTEADQELWVTVNLEKGNYVTAFGTIEAGVTICLAGCGISSFAGALIDCWSKTRDESNRREAFIACLKEKGADIGSSYLQCAIGCLAGAAAV